MSSPLFGSSSSGTLKLQDEGTAVSVCKISQDASAISQDPGFSLEDFLRTVFLVT